jgi:serine/threonine-protein kinase
MQMIGRYEVIDELGRGAMGVVYRARDTQIGRVVALKVIHTANASAEDVERYKQRFRREAQAAGRLSHPGIVTIHDIAEDETGQPYLVMEYIEGRPLNLLLGPTAQVPLDKLLDIGIQVAQALDYAHGKGIVHRDIKPPNILVTTDGRAKIADFGIARLEGTELTQEGTSLGTPSYMSPEQFRGSAVDARSDQFSLGAVLYWMFTGQKPFNGDTVTALSFQVVFEAPARVNQLKAGLPAALDVILSRCLAKQPDDRYANCGALAADLEALKAGRPLPVSSRASPQGVASVEATAATSPAGEAAAPVSAGNERTQPVPVPASAEKTRLISTAASVTAPARKPRPRGLAWIIGAAAAVLLLGVAGGAYWLGQRTEPPPPIVVQPPAAPLETPPVTALPPSAPAETASRPEREEKEPARAATSLLRITCKHNFRSARLEVYVDDQLLLKTALRGKEHNYGVVKVYEGTLELPRPITPGHHSLRAWVIAERESYDQQAGVSGEFSENASRLLEITFGKGSAIGVVNRKLDVVLY